MNPPPSDPLATGSVAPHPTQAEDVIDLRRIVLVGLGSLLVFAIGIAWSWWILVARDPDHQGPGSSAGARRLGAQEIGIVDQVLFEGDRRLRVSREQQERRLRSWGWVDRQRGMVHMPIDEAMRRVVQDRGETP
jgi:hypothetical protein